LNSEDNYNIIRNIDCGPLLSLHAPTHEREAPP
jgi:hypothetical protein